ncbi:hypothetical protein KC887_05310 [Candidatus Kaiserbacteria bacterium]|nr:hypothetical protein [Candidatus Kaiserbacteria bacterium]
MPRTNLLTTKWQNDIQRTIVAIRPGGGGYPWQILDTEHALDAISGGGTSVSSRRLIQSGRGRPSYAGKILDQALQAFTGNLTVGISPEARNTLGFFTAPEAYILGCDSPTTYDIAVLENCGSLDSMISYEELKIYTDVVATGLTPSGNLKNGGDETAGAFVSMGIAVDAAYMLETAKLKHLDTKAGNANVGINDVVYYKWKTWYAVSDLLTASSCKLFYSEDDGATWASTNITTLSTASDVANQIDIGNGKGFIASPQDGVTYFTLPTSGAPSGFTAATVGGSAWATNFPNAVLALSSVFVIAVGDGGHIWTSTTGVDFTEPTASASVSTEDLGVALGLSKRLAVFGGTNVELVRYYNGTYSAFTVGGGVGGTDTITALGSPSGDPNRANWLYVGTSAGDIAYTKDITSSAPTWTAVSIPGVTGSGSIDDIEFDPTGNIMTILHTTGGASTVYRDLSGGAGGFDVETVASPLSVTMNAIASRSLSHMVAVGEASSSLGYTGLITE